MKESLVSLEWSVKNLDEMKAGELYEMLKLRADVFVIEQDCIYPDMDNKDQKALHVIGKKNGKVIACTRIFNAGDYFEEASIGRVVLEQSERRFGYGHTLISKSLQAIEEYFGKQTVKISAQEYLIKFYNKHGFKQVGEGYLEDGIPHVSMIRN